MATKSRPRRASSSKTCYSATPDKKSTRSRSQRASSSKTCYSATPDKKSTRSRSQRASSSKTCYSATPDKKSKTSFIAQYFRFSKYRETAKIMYNDVQVHLSQFIRCVQNRDSDVPDHRNGEETSDISKPRFRHDVHDHRNRKKACDILKPSLNYNVYDHQDKVGDKSKPSFIYRCYPFSYINKCHCEDGNKIIMPESALDALISMKHFERPPIFKIINPLLHKSSHCGVLEFSGKDSSVYLPNWMMNSLLLQQGQLVNVEYTALSKGTFLKLQPHSTKFIMNLSNPKEAMERILKDFACVSIGDTIMVNHENQCYYLNIVQARPKKAVSLIETDCELEFTNALDHKELEKIKPKVEGTTSLDDDDNKLVVSLRTYSTAIVGDFDGNGSLRRNKSSRGHHDFDGNCSLRRNKSRGHQRRQ